MTLDMIIDQYTKFLTFNNKEITSEQIAVLNKIWEEIGGQFANNTRENEPLHLAMKELTLQNIGPYADLTVGFDATGLVAVDGQVGAGKSTIFESMFFALTGRTNKFGSTNMKHLKSKVHNGEALIQLTFELNGVEYVIQKKRTSGNTASLKGGEIDISGVDEVQAQMEALIPLTHTELAYCLYLAQGEWDTMLSATPTNLRRMAVEKVLNLNVYTSIHTKMGVILHQAEADLNNLQGQKKDRTSVRDGDRIKFNGLSWVQNGLFQKIELADGSFIPGITEAFKTLTADVQDQMTQHLLMEQRLKETVQQLQSNATQPAEASLSLVDLNKLKDLVQELDGLFQTLALLYFNKSTVMLSAPESQELHGLIEMISNGQMTSEIFSSMIAEHQALSAQKDNALQSQNVLGASIVSAKSEQSAVLMEYEQVQTVHQSHVDALAALKKTIEEKQLMLVNVGQQLQQNTSDLDASNQALTQLLTDLTAVYESLLTQSVGFIQQYIQNHDLDECPVCTGDLGTMSQENDCINTDSIDYTQQKDDLIAKKVKLETLIDGLTIDIQNGQMTLQNLNTEIQSLNDDIDVLSEVMSASAVNVQQVFNAVESAQEVLNDLQGTFDAHQTIIDDATVQIGSMSKLVTMNHQTVLGLIQKASDIYEEWTQIQANNDVLTSVVLEPKTIAEIQTLILKEESIHAAEPNDQEHVLQQTQRDLEGVLQAKRLYWSQFENEHPEWMGRVKVNGLSVADWTSLCTAVQLQKELQAHAVQIQIIEEKLATQIQKVSMIKSMQADFHNGNQGIQFHLSSALFSELCSLAQDTLKSFFGPGCELKYKKAFELTHNGIKLPVKALSGGERFYVAVALAFAMRQFIQDKRSIQMTTLFIDEGFHMLKDQHMSQMVDTLKSKSDGTAIWLITHNAALVNQIETVYTASSGDLILSTSTISIA